MPADQSTERHPFMSLLQFLLLVLGGTLLFTCLSFVIGILIYGTATLSMLREGVISDNTIAFLKIMQAGYTIGTYIIPAILFARMKKHGIGAFLNLSNKIPVILLLVAICTMYTATPIIEWTMTVNKQMHLPEFLKTIENWMREQEDQAAVLTKEILKMKSISGLLINFVLIAVLPAIGEEFTFRGCFQTIFTRWAGNYHWGIWLAAILFSAIHMQFYGFIPRMLLGAMFGYMLVWGRSMWLPVLAHLINNGGAVITAYMLQQKGQSLDTFEDVQPASLTVYVLSVIVTILLLGYMYYNWKKFPDLSETEIIL